MTEIQKISVEMDPKDMRSWWKEHKIDQESFDTDSTKQRFWISALA